MAGRPKVTKELSDEYCERFRNWGKWGPDDEVGAILVALAPRSR